MSVIRHRREVLKLALTAASLLPAAALPSRVFARSKAAELAVQPLSDRLSLVTGGAGNIVVLRGDDGLLLVDGGAAADARALQKLLAERFGRLPVKTLFNTHWHLAHTGFNAEARRQGAEVLAHENTRLWMSTVVNSRWEDRVYPAQPEAARPTKTFYDGVQTLEFAGQKIEYGLLAQAHTDGDIYVRFPADDVIVTGDVFAPGRYPTLDPASNGWLGGMYQGLKALAAMGKGNARFVPGVGPVGDAAALKKQQDMCVAVLTRIGESYYKGDTWEQLVASAPTKEFDGAFGNPDLFLRQSYESAWYHVNEIRRVAR